MKLLENKTNITAPDADYPFGSVRDKTPSVAGTIWNFEQMSDAIQFFSKMFAESGLTANGLPDNATNTFQLYEAFRKLTKPYKVLTGLLTQSGTAAPTVTILGLNEIGTPVMAYTSVGSYTLTITGEFITAKTTWSIATGLNGSTESFLRNVNEDYFIINSYQTGAVANNILTNTPFEIRVYD